VIGGLERLNRMPGEEARETLLRCCRSTTWAERMAELRPFEGSDELFEVADRTWWKLAPEDWEEAFASHPRIGEREPEERATSAWSEGEQAGAASAAEETKQALAEGNQAYEARFGRTYIVCATGKSAEQMLDILRNRLDNEPDRELGVAAEEQRRITRIRLRKLLSDLAEEGE